MEKEPNPMFSEVTEFVINNSYIYCSDQYDNIIEFETRRNGDASCSQCSELDVDECERVKKLLLSKYDGITIRITTCDEWVTLEVTF